MTMRPFRILYLVSGLFLPVAAYQGITIAGRECVAGCILAAVSGLLSTSTP